MPTRLHSAVLAATVLGMMAVATSASALEAEYAWNLATTTGALRTSGSNLSWDRHGKELFVVDGGVVRVFSRTGMEIFSFGDDAQLGRVYAVAPLDDGDLLLLSGQDDQISVIRSNFRGEPLSKVALTGVPAEIAEDFRPNGLAFAAGKMFLADKRSMRLVVANLSGAVTAVHDLAVLVDVADKRENTGIRGFSVDAAGNVFFTVQPLFRAFVLGADGRLEGFGQKGSAAGKFNVVGPIVSDEQGNVYVGDLLRSVVIVFDKQLKFVREIGSRGKQPGALLVPSELAVGDGKVFVSQYASRGVSVFRVADKG